jgi:polysaccharide export outer membrane protein
MNITRLFLIVLVVIMSACTPLKKTVYLQNDSTQTSGTYPEFVLRIKANDILSIQVFTINADAFPGIASTIDKAVIDNRTPYEKGIIVDQNGFIDMPLIGKIKLEGMSILEAKDSLVKRFSFYMDDPIVMLKKLSFKITVLGEVNKPGLYYVQNEKITLLEALGTAGDLTFYGDRQEIKIVRQNGNGYREILVDLTSHQPLNSEVAYLYPDDVVYVKPIKKRKITTVSPSVAVYTSIIATLTLVVSLLLRETN